MIAGGDIGLDAAGLLQRVGQQLLGDLAGVELLAADGERGVGDDVGGVELVLGRVGAVGRPDIVDQPLIERPGIHPAFPVVDDGVAEAEGLGLHVGHARRDPGGAGSAQIFLGRLGEQRIDGELERVRGRRGVFIGRLGEIGIGLEHVLGGGRRGRLGGRRRHPKTKTECKEGKRPSNRGHLKHPYPFRAAARLESNVVRKARPWTPCLPWPGGLLYA